MLPSSVSQYLPHTGLFLLLLGLIFAIVAVADYPTKDSKDPAFAMANATKFTSFSYALVFAGGFILMSTK